MRAAARVNPALASGLLERPGSEPRDREQPARAVAAYGVRVVRRARVERFEQHPELIGKESCARQAEQAYPGFESLPSPLRCPISESLLESAGFGVRSPEG